MAKYLTEFNTYADYSGATLSIPNVSLIKSTGEVYYNPMFRGATVGDVLMYDVANQKLISTLLGNWDATTYPIASYEPVAICVIPSNQSGDGYGHWMSLLDIDVNGSGTTGTSSMVWSTESVLVGTSTDLNNYVGRSNTNAILATANYSQSTYPAAYAVNTHATSGTSAGDWYLPSIGELKAAYSGKTTIQAQLTLINSADSSKATALKTSYLYYWSSTESTNGTGFAYNEYFSNGAATSVLKNKSHFVRSFLML